jgi:hypothetical protein
MATCLTSKIVVAVVGQKKSNLNYFFLVQDEIQTKWHGMY